MKDQNIRYNLGKRDALAQILMLLRVEGDYEKTILKLAKELPENPHAQFFIKKLEK